MHNTLSITIHVHERVDELRRLLSSLAANESLKACRCLVVNNATAKSASRAVLQTISEFSALAITELNQPGWETLQTTLDYLKSNESARKWLSQMRLGESGWAVHAARNIGMIASVLLYDNVTHVLNLDSDILIPPDLKLNAEQLPSFGCLQIKGCPDLSRLEWIELLCRVTANKSGISLQCPDNYIGRLVNRNETGALKALLDNYTDLLPPVVERLPEKEIAYIVPREEYYGACYILKVDRFKYSPVPSWYDNDWSFFSSIRQKDDTFDFLPHTVEHLASQKTILCQRSMQHEEYGKLLYLAARNGGNLSSCENAREFRLNEIRRIFRLIKQVQSGVDCRNSEDTLVQANNFLEYLYEFVLEKISITDIQSDLYCFADEVNAWRRNFPLIRSTGSLGGSSRSVLR